LKRRKRKQHYVWRHYLKSWAPGGSIFCLRGHDIFSSSLDGVANRRDFYKPEPLLPEELALVRVLAVDSAAKHLRGTNEGWLKTLLTPQLVLPALSQHADKFTGSEVETIEEMIHNFEEDFYAGLENAAIKQLAALRRCDASFLQDDMELIGFLHFICLQSLRTAKMQDQLVAAVQLKPPLRFVPVWQIVRHVFASNIASMLYFGRRDWRLLFLTNFSARPFLTGDQPVINTYAARQPPGTQVDNLELYYPLSPRLAVLLTETVNVPNGHRSSLNLQEVDMYNGQIVRSAHEQIYADSRRILEQVAGGLYKS
jgi:hypothetical protein